MYLFLEVETPSCNANKDETNVMPFNKTTTDLELVMLETKLNIPPDHSYHSLSELIQKFTQHCSIDRSSFSGMIMGKHCVTVKFIISTLTLPILEKKIKDSEKSLSDMKVSLVKILGKTIFETDSDHKVFL